MNIGDVELETSSQTSLAELTEGSGSASEAYETSQVSKKHFTEKALDILNDLRYKGELCDAVIKLDGVSFLVHRNILSACSSYFKALFTSKGFHTQVLASPQEVVLTGISADVLGFLIDYAYGRSVLLTPGNVQDILHAADRFLVPGLARECCIFIKRHLSPENCLGIAKFANAYFRPGLEKAAYQFIYQNFSDILAKSTEYLELEAEQVYQLLASDYLNVRTEELVFEAVCKWVQHGPEKRKADVPRLLRAVRMGFLTTQFVVEKIKPHPLIRESEEARAIVVDALKYLCKLDMKEHRKMELSSPMATPRVPHEILFVIGGWSGGSPTNMVETYDTRADHWLVCKTPDRGPRAYHACVVLEHYIYVLGGFDGIEYFNSCRKFRPSTLCWSEAPPMHSKRCYLAAVNLHGVIYALGGFDGHVRLNTVERFDSKTSQWSFVQPMLNQRSDAKATVLGDKIYICGGFNGQECLNSAESYDPVTKQWTLIPAMRNKRSGVGVIAYNGKVYALGGFNGITRMNTGERYCPETRSWTTIPEMCHPRSNFAVGVIDDMLFAIGGFNGVTTIPNVECFDSASDEWFDAAELSLFRSALCACVIKNISNVQEFVYKPNIEDKKRGNYGTSSVDGASASSPDGPVQSINITDHNFLNQLA